MLRYRRVEPIRAELARLANAENGCCNVDGIRFAFTETAQHYEVVVSAPAEQLQTESVQVVLSNFESMPARSTEDAKRGG